MSLENFCRDIVPTRVLTGSETIEVCSFHSDMNYKPVLPELCGNTQPRTSVCTQHRSTTTTQPRTTMNSFIRSPLITLNLSRSRNMSRRYTLLHEVSLNILTHHHRIELCSLVLFSDGIVDNYLANNYTVKISQVGYCPEHSPPVLVPAQAFVQYPDNVINFSASTILLPNSEYEVTISSPCAAFHIDHYDNNSKSNNHLTVRYCQLAFVGRGFYSCFESIKYFTLTQ